MKDGDTIAVSCGKTVAGIAEELDVVNLRLKIFSMFVLCTDRARAFHSSAVAARFAALGPQIDMLGYTFPADMLSQFVRGSSHAERRQKLLPEEMLLYEIRLESLP